jgi:cytochrome c
MFRFPIRIATAFAALMFAASAFAAAPREPLPPGDADHGQELYAECKGCHALNVSRVGPPHCGVIGRAAGSVENYHYSDVMKRAGFAWDESHLDAFLNSPISYLNGTNMGFAGYFDPQDRADIIAYLKKAMNPEVCKDIVDPPPPPDLNKAE